MLNWTHLKFWRLPSLLEWMHFSGFESPARLMEILANQKAGSRLATTVPNGILQQNNQHQVFILPLQLQMGAYFEALDMI